MRVYVSYEGKRSELYLCTTHSQWNWIDNEHNCCMAEEEETMALEVVTIGENNISTK